MKNELMFLALALVAMCGYAYFAFQLSRVVQPLRLKVAENIEELIADESIPLAVRADLDRLGGSLLSTRLAWLFVLTYPLGVFHALKGGDKRAVRISSHSKHNEIARTFSEGLLCTVATSPLCTLIFAFEAALLMLLWIPLGRSARRALHLVFKLLDDDRNCAHGATS